MYFEVGSHGNMGICTLNRKSWEHGNMYFEVGSHGNMGTCTLK
jgi:hypothetical protein